MPRLVGQADDSAGEIVTVLAETSTTTSRRRHQQRASGFISQSHTVLAFTLEENISSGQTTNKAESCARERGEKIRRGIFLTEVVKQYRFCTATPSSGKKLNYLVF